MRTPSFIRIAVQPLELFRSEDILQSLNKNFRVETRKVENFKVMVNCCFVGPVVWDSRGTQTTI